MALDITFMVMDPKILAQLGSIRLLEMTYIHTHIN